MLSECRILEAKIIRENSNGVKKIKIAGKFQEAEEPNNNKRKYRRPILESAVNNLQDKIKDRSLVGALDHPPNDIVHLSQASHLITKLYMKGNEVIGEAEILSTPSGKVVQALIEDGVKLGISSRGVGSLTEGKDGISEVNDDFKLITFDIVADPSTKGAFASLTESVKSVNTKKVETILNKFKSEKVLEVLLMDKINKVLKEYVVDSTKDKKQDYDKMAGKGIKKDSKDALNFKVAVTNPPKSKQTPAKGGKKSGGGSLDKSVKVGKSSKKESTLLDKYRKLLNEGVIKLRNKAKKKDRENTKGLEIRKKQNPDWQPEPNSPLNKTFARIAQKKGK